MTRLIQAIRQLMPSTASVVAYWLVSAGLLILVTAGLEATGEQSGALWSHELRGFGATSLQILSNAYLEMMNHVWTVVALPYLCFVGLKPICRSYRSDFTQFLRFSHGSRLFMEGARALALISLVLLVSAPFAAAAIWGRWDPGLAWQDVCTGFASCAATILFVAVMVYLLVSYGTPTEVTIGTAIATPFFLTGLSWFFEKGGYTFLHAHLPPGLPYSVDSYSDTNLQVAVALAAVGIVSLLLPAGCTRWLRVAKGGTGHGNSS